MATKLTQFQTARLARKSSDISNLVKQYKTGLSDVASQYQTSFAEYQKKRDEMMAPYEAATEKYKADFGAFETASAGYKTRLSDFQAKLAEVQANPMEQMSFYLTHNDGSPNYRDVVINGVGRFREDRLPSGYIDVVENNQRKIYRKKAIPKFTEEAPVAPEIPTAPEIGEFDTSQFDAKRAEVESTYKRELGERRSARASAVSRKQARPLLQGA